MEERIQSTVLSVVVNGVLDLLWQETQKGEIIWVCAQRDDMITNNVKGKQQSRIKR